MSRDFDVVIVGAGVAAATLASLLLTRKLSTPGRVALLAERIVAPQRSADWGLRVFALSRASERLLRICGVWQSLPPGRISAYERMCVWDARGTAQGDGSLSFDCAQIGEPNLGHIVEGDALQRQCLAMAAAAGAVCIEAQISGVVAGDADTCLRLSDGREVRSALLVAADGAESRTRGLLGIETAGHAYHQDALVAHVRTAKPHRNTAWQRFLSTGPLAFLPMADGRSSIVWSVARAQAARLLALTPAAFAAALTEASAGVLGDCELTTPVADFPLKMQYALDYIGPRAVLLGDAAHAVHPLAGQGLNLGLLDVAVLADVLGEAAKPGYFGDPKLLRRYERRRRSDNILMATALDALERLFSRDDALSARLRVAGLNAIGQLSFVKRQLAERALGLRGDVPAFLSSDASLRGDPASRRK